MIRKLSLMSFAVLFFTKAFSLTVNYELRMENPNAHYFQVKMVVSDIQSNSLDIKMPVWAPGSYLVREFAKSVNLVKANANGNDLEINKTRKNTWHINSNGVTEVEIDYEVYAFELSVRTSFLDDSHAYVNGSSMFMYVDGGKEANGKLKIIPCKAFKKISTPLTKKGKNTFLFSNYDELVDSPIEIGNQKEYQFEAAGVTHTIAMYGKGNYDIERLKKDMAKVVEAETDVFKENPNKEYLFIIHNLTVGSGGLEHKKATTLEVERWTYDDKNYLGFISLVAHEYFHLWNVKRIRPKALGPFDYDNENYTDLLWVMEGFTSYYDELILRRSGFYSEEDYMNRIIGTINYVENQPGNKVQPVAHSSYDAWIKAYRHNENSINTTISYYSKGQILACMLDLYIIKKTKGEKSLDDFMQKLYADFYKKNDVGFTEDEFNKTLTDFVGEDMSWFIKSYVYDTKSIDYDTFFSGVGVNLVNSTKGPEPYLGVRTSMHGGKLVVDNVFSGSSAEKYGISVNDELISVDGFRVDSDKFSYYMSTKNIEDEFEVVLSRDEIIKTYTIKMGEREPVRYKYSLDLTSTTRQLYNYWLRVTVNK